jgi:hypothetical protein
MVGGSSKVVGRIKPSYPNWQRKRTQNPSSVGSNPTEGTRKPQARALIRQNDLTRKLRIVRGTYALTANLHLCGSGSCLTFEVRLLLYGFRTRFR